MERMQTRKQSVQLIFAKLKIFLVTLYIFFFLIFKKKTVRDYTKYANRSTKYPTLEHYKIQGLLVPMDKRL